MSRIRGEDLFVPSAPLQRVSYVSAADWTELKASIPLIASYFSSPDLRVEPGSDSEHD